MSNSNGSFPKVEIANIKALKVASTKGGVKVSFEVEAPGPEVLKLMWMAGTAQSMNAVIESPQAEFDMTMTVVKISTGEVVP